MTSPPERLAAALAARYAIERKLGEGATSEVFAARRVADGQMVAVKVLRRDVAAEVGTERFLREVRVASALAHPSIVPVLDSGVADGVPWQAMPLVRGETLRERLSRERQLPLTDALTIAQQVAAALDVAHAAGVVHRDIKPENILLDGDRAFVTDFGVAYAIDAAVGDRITASGLTVGTPQYMSPEQSSAERHLDGRSDVYSLACVCFEMLAGQPPFTGATAQAIRARHVTEAPPSVLVVRPSLGPAVDAALQRGLAKSPADRPGTASALIELMESTIATPTPVRPRPRGWGRVAVLAVAALIVAIAVAQGDKTPATPALDPSRVAVLYPDVAGQDSQTIAVARGLTRDLIYALSRTPGLQLISESGIRGLGADARVDSVGRALGVGTVVVSALERAGDSLRYDVRLVDANTLVQETAIRDTRPFAMLIAMRDTVARVVSAHLLRTIGRTVQEFVWRGETRSARAWALRQRARDLQLYAEAIPTNPSDFTPQYRALATAESLLVLAGGEDPEWEEPVVGRGWALVRRSQLSTGTDQRRALDTADAIAARAVARWPGAARPLELRGVVHLERWKNLPGTAPAVGDSAERDLRAATMADPQLARAWMALSDVLGRKGDTTGSDAAARRAIETDGYGSFAGRTMVNLMFRQMFRRQFDSARAACALARRRFPSDSYVQSCELSVLGWSGSGEADTRRIRELATQTEQSGAFPLVAGMFPVGRLWVAGVLARSGRGDSARAVLAETQARLRSAGSADEFAMNEAHVLALIGDREAAMERLGAALRRDPAKRSLIAALPWFDPLRGQPRFAELVGAR